MQNERQLVKAIQRGDAAAFADFLDRYGARVHSLARRHTRCVADADDITQEVFVDLYRGIGNFRGESSLSTWVYRVAMNHCLKHRERAKPDSLSFNETLHETMDTNADPLNHATNHELRGQIDGALDKLTEAHRSVVVLHEMHGLTYAECAAVLEIPVGTVKSRLSNAFKNLRERLTPYVLGDEPGNLSHAAKFAPVEAIQP